MSVASTLAILGLAAVAAPPASEPAAMTPRQKTGYTLGFDYGSSLSRDGYDVDPDAFARGLADALRRVRPAITEAEMKAVLDQLRAEVKQRRIQTRTGLAPADVAVAEKNRAEGAAFLTANAQKPGVNRFPNGLQYKVLVAGTGPKPALTDRVVCKVSGTLVDGTDFGEPPGPKVVTLAVKDAMLGWSLALREMPVGSRWQLFIPPELGYGQAGSGRVGPNATVVLDVELQSIAAR